MGWGMALWEGVFWERQKGWVERAEWRVWEPICKEGGGEQLNRKRTFDWLVHGSRFWL